METEKDKKTQYEAGSTLLGDGIKFSIPFWLGTKLTLNIRPLHPGTIVRISQQSTKISDVYEDENMINELMKTGDNLKIFCRIVALGVLNNPVKIRMLAGWLTRVLMWRVTSTQELFSYVSLVYRQMGAEHFFFIMTLTKGMNFLKKKTNGQERAWEAKHSGVRSP